MFPILLPLLQVLTEKEEAKASMERIAEEMKGLKKVAEKISKEETVLKSDRIEVTNQSRLAETPACCNREL